MNYTKEQISNLRQIPILLVQQAFSLEKTDDKKVKNAVDVLTYQKKLNYKEAVNVLAQQFPDFLDGKALINNVNTQKIEEQLVNAGVPATLRRSAKEIIKQLDSFGCDKFAIYINNPENPKQNFSNFWDQPGGWSKKEVLENVAMLAARNVAGGHIFINGIYENTNKIKLLVDEVDPAGEFVKKYEPNLILKTSREKFQAHYVVERKYDKAFYDLIAININMLHGDEGVKSAGHDTRLAGFANKKQQYEIDGKFPFVSVVSSSPVRSSEFEKYIDEQYELYKNGEFKCLAENVTVQNVLEKSDIETKMSDLKVVDIRENLLKKVFEYREEQLEKYGAGDRSKIDYSCAAFLFSRGASTDEVYSFLKQNALQNADFVKRRHGDGSEYVVSKHRTEKSLDRYARRTTINCYVKNGFEKQDHERDEKRRRMREKSKSVTARSLPSRPLRPAQSQKKSADTLHHKI